METDNENQEHQEKIYYNWLFAFLFCVILISLKALSLESIDNMSWWWVLMPLWLPFPLSLIISLIRKFF